MYYTEHSNTGPVHKKQGVVHLFGIQMAGLSRIQIELKNQTIEHPTSFRPVDYQTKLRYQSKKSQDLNTGLVRDWNRGKPDQKQNGG